MSCLDRRGCLLVIAGSMGCSSAISREGIHVEQVVIREHNAWGHEWPTVHLRGSSLRRAVDLLDRHHLIQSSSGDRIFEDPDVSDGSSAIVEIETATGRQRIVLTNCPQTHVCSFLRDAFDDALIDRIPETCMPILTGYGLDACPAHLSVDQECFVRQLLQDGGAD